MPAFRFLTLLFALAGLGLLFYSFQTATSASDSHGYDLYAAPRLDNSVCCQRSGTPTDTLIALKILQHIPTLLDTGNYATDRILAEKALEIANEYWAADHPQWPELHYYLGRAYLQLGEHDGSLLTLATKYLEKAHDRYSIRQSNISPEYPLQTQYLLMNAHYFSGNLQKAYQCGEELIQLKKTRKETTDLDYAIYVETFGLISMEMGYTDKGLEAILEGYRIKKKLLSKDHLWLIYSEALLGSGYFYKGEMRQSISYYELILERLMADPVRNQEDIIVTLGNLGSFYRAIRNSQKALDYFHKKNDLLKQKGGGTPRERRDLLYGMGEVHLNIHRLQPAKKYFEECLELYQQEGQGNSMEAIRVYNALGVVNRTIGAFKLAEEYHQKALVICETIGKQTIPDFTSATYSALGRLYREMEDFSKATATLQDALELRNKVSPDGNDHTATIHGALGLVYLDQGQIDQAIQQFQQMLGIYERLVPLNRCVALDYLSSAYLKKGDLINAEKYALAAIDASKVDSTVIYPNTLGSSYLNLAEVRKQQGAIAVAHTYIDTVMKQFHFTHVDALEQVHSLRWVLAAQEDRGDLFLESYQRHQDADAIARAVEAYEQAIRLFTALQSTIQDAPSELDLFRKYDLVFEKCIKARLLANPKDPAIFQVNERRKDYLLRQSFYEADARKILNIPPAILQKEQDLENQRMSIQNELSFELEKTDRNDTLLANLKNQRFELNQQLRAFREELLQQYPRYHELKYEQTPLGVRELQNQLLEHGQVLLSYLLGDSTIYISIIQKNSYELLKVTEDIDLEKNCSDFIRTIAEVTDPLLRTDATEQERKKRFNELAYRLYQQIFAPVEEFLGGARELIILTEGPLNNLPFEALLTAPTDPAIPFSDSPFLLRQPYTISYNFSASLLHSMQHQQHNCSDCEDFLVIAPSYRQMDQLAEPAVVPSLSERYGFSSIPENPLEAQKLVASHGGRLDTFGRKSSFLDMADRFRVIHFYVHGQLNPQKGEESFLALMDEQNTGQIAPLFVRELYGQPLHADLLVLAACETGIGNIQPGEGAISMARGGAYGGAKSILTSLWKVDPHSTHQLMQRFYTHLFEKNRRKGMALKAAKVELLEDPNHSDPYYWASFIAIGDMAPLQKSWAWWKSGWFLLLISGILVFFTWRHWKSR